MASSCMSERALPKRADQATLERHRRRRQQPQRGRASRPAGLLQHDEPGSTQLQKRYASESMVRARASSHGAEACPLLTAVFYPRNEPVRRRRHDCFNRGSMDKRANVVDIGIDWDRAGRGAPLSRDPYHHHRRYPCHPPLSHGPRGTLPAARPSLPCTLVW